MSPTAVARYAFILVVVGMASTDDPQTTTATTTTTTTTLKTTTTPKLIYLEGNDPIVKTVWPLHGPVAGGTIVTITGEYLDSATVVLGHIGALQTLERSDSRLVVVTPPSNQSGLVLPIRLTVDNFEPVFVTYFKFSYLPNPEINSIVPTDHLITGGTTLTVTGMNVDSSASPQIHLTRRLTATNSDSVSTTDNFDSSLSCSAVDQSTLVCVVPQLNLSTSFQENTQSCPVAPGAVSSLCASGKNGVDRADVYIGFQFDGFTLYSNIVTRLAAIKINFYSPPTIDVMSKVIGFIPVEQTSITIKGQNMQRGCRLSDYSAWIGWSRCVSAELTDSSFTCHPPEELPLKNNSDTSCSKEKQRNVRLTIGFQSYHVACLEYKKPYIGILEYIFMVFLVIPFVGFVIIFAAMIHRCCTLGDPKSLQQPVNGNNGAAEAQNSAYLNMHDDDDGYGHHNK